MADEATIWNPGESDPVPGPKGDPGDPGPPNTLTIGEVNEGTTANASITGESPNQVLNLILPRGAKGEKGDPGQNSNLSIGTVTTVDNTEEAAATITGSPPTQVLNLSIPRGPAGPGAGLTIGTVSHGDEAAATIEGDPPNQVLSLTLPRGQQGVPGLSNTLTVGTVTAGPQPQVTITGQSPNQIINFVLQRGPKGDTGEALNLRGELDSTADLPSTGQGGDAYLIDGDIWAWMTDDEDWANIGSIQGPPGESAYQIWLDEGNTGTEQDFLDSLVGPEGPQGEQGPQGIQGLPGEDGRPIEVQNSGTHIQWRYVGDTVWINLVSLDDITGPQGEQGIQGIEGPQGPAGNDGQEVELQVSSTHIQWRLGSSGAWQDLVALADLQGPEGPEGPQGPPGEGALDSVVAGDNISVNNTDPANPIVGVSNNPIFKGYITIQSTFDNFIDRWGANPNPPSLTFRKARGNYAAPEKIVPGDRLGGLFLAGRTGEGTFNNAASWEAYAGSSWDTAIDAGVEVRYTKKLPTSAGRQNILIFTYNNTIRLGTTLAQKITFGGTTNPPDPYYILSNGAIKVTQPICAGPFTVATLPSAVDFVDAIVACTNHPSGSRLLQSDGTNWIPYAPYTPPALSFFAAGEILTGDLLTRIRLGKAISLPSGLTGSTVDVLSPSSSDTTLSIKRNNVEIATATIPASATTGTFTMASAVTLSAGDFLSVECTAGVDASDLSLTLVGV